MKKYSLTHSQKRIWYVEKLYQNTPISNLGGFVEIKAPIDFSILEKSILSCIRQNEGLHLSIQESVSGEAYQYLRADREYEVVTRDFYGFSDPFGEAKKFMQERFRTPLPLTGRLFEIIPIRLGDMGGGYFIKLHHIIADGWTFQIVTNQINKVYAELLQGKVKEYCGPSYIDYIEREQKYLNSGRFSRDAAFWRDQFNQLPDNTLNDMKSELIGERKTYMIDERFSLQLNEFLKKNDWSPNTFFTALMYVYLFKTVGQKELSIGMPILNRFGPTEKNTVGMFTSTIPVRGTIHDSTTIMKWIEVVNKQIYRGLQHQKYPYELLLREIKRQHPTCYELFSVSVNYYNTHFQSKFSGVEMGYEEFYSGYQSYPLQLVIKEWSDKPGMVMQFDYRFAEYVGADIDAMYMQLIHLTNQVIADPTLRITQLELLTKQEQEERIYERNHTEHDYPFDKTVLELFEEQSALHPDRIALEHNGNEVSYQRLNQLANQCARRLHKENVGRDSIVAILMSHSIEMVIAILGVLKTGAAYLPIDPTNPANRIEFILEDSGAELVLCNKSFKTLFSYTGCTIYLNTDDFVEEATTNLEKVNEAEDRVYMIYTSGSTGKPKGVVIEHRGLINYIWWAKNQYLDDQDVFALYSSLAFDLTITSLFTPLANGNRIIIYTENSDEFILHSILKDNKVSIIKLTPAHLSLLQNYSIEDSRLRKLIVGGEELKTRLAAQMVNNFNGELEIYNEYGPTETVVGCTVHRFDIKKDKGVCVPIGKPISNARIYVLNEYFQPVPDEVIGEVFIGGDGVAREYYNRPELTVERFIPNPFIPGERMYRTGDLAKYTRENDLMYMGRSDFQVKVQGFRIELGEIEDRLMTYPGIKEAYVMDVNTDHDRTLLAAFLVVHEGQECRLEALHAHLTETMPYYMMPATFTFVDALPLNSNGKVDRTLLSSNITSHSVQSYSSLQTTNEWLYSSVVNVMKDILQTEEICDSDNFYYLGGDSIKAIQISAKLSEINIQLEVKDIMAYPVIGQLISVCKSGSRNLQLSEEVTTSTLNPTPIWDWFMNSGHTNPNYYLQTIALNVKTKDVDLNWKAIFLRLFSHHDTLRLHYDIKEKKFRYQKQVEEENDIFEFYDLSDFSCQNQMAMAEQKAEAVKRSIQLVKFPLMKGVLFKLNETESKLLLIAHHVVVDGISWRIIVEDLEGLMISAISGQEHQFPPKTLSYQKWAENWDKWRHEGLTSEEADYWKRMKVGEAVFPVDFNKGNTLVKNSETANFKLSAEETERFFKQANRAFNTRGSELLLASLALAWIKYTGNEVMTFEMESHGRQSFGDETDVSRTLGWFTVIYPLTIFLQQRNDLQHLITEVKEQFRKTPNGGAGYGIYKDESESINTERTGRVRFNYLGEWNERAFNGLLELNHEGFALDSDQDNRITSLIDIQAQQIKGQLTVSITYSQSNFNKSSMEKFLHLYKESVHDICDFCCAQSGMQFTPSDFELVDLLPDDLENIFN